MCLKWNVKVLEENTVELTNNFTVEKVLLNITQNPGTINERLLKLTT